MAAVARWALSIFVAVWILVPAACSSPDSDESGSGTADSADLSRSLSYFHLSIPPEAEVLGWHELDGFRTELHLAVALPCRDVNKLLLDPSAIPAERLRADYAPELIAQVLSDPTIKLPPLSHYSGGMADRGAFPDVQVLVAPLTVHHCAVAIYAVA